MRIVESNSRARTALHDDLMSRIDKFANAVAAIAAVNLIFLLSELTMNVVRVYFG